MNKDRTQFIAALVEDFPNKSIEDVMRIANLLMRHSATHKRLAVRDFNGDASESEVKRLQDVARRIKAIADSLGLRVNCDDYDPRGFTVKVHLPSGRSNSMGGREAGYGVPNGE